MRVDVSMTVYESHHLQDYCLVRVILGCGLVYMNCLYHFLFIFIMIVVPSDFTCTCML